MINLVEILALVDDYVDRNAETMTELSRRATGKNDTIRNWKRRLEKGQEASASFQNVQAVLAAIGVEIALNGALSPISTSEEIKTTLQRIVGLDKRGQELALTVIENHMAVNRGTKPSQGAADDQPSSPISRHG
jgi:hypothetical protein